MTDKPELEASDDRSCSPPGGSAGGPYPRFNDAAASGDRKKTCVIAPVRDFVPGSRLRLLIGDLAIAVFNIDGNFWAIRDRCPHQFAPLSSGRLQGTVVCSAQTNWQLEWVNEGEVLVCPGHGMEFDIRTGRAYGHRNVRLTTYEVRVENDEVSVVLPRSPRR
jgi:nitrite reductase (NADH) small subunit